MPEKQTEGYNVYCIDCGSVFTPAFKSPLWWQAKQKAEKGYLDALCVSGGKCGCCAKKQHEPNAPFRVFGYTMDCENFDYARHTFVGAIRKFLELNCCCNTVFIKGVSASVERKLCW